MGTLIAVKKNWKKEKNLEKRGKNQKKIKIRKKN